MVRQWFRLKWIVLRRFVRTAFIPFHAFKMLNTLNRIVLICAHKPERLTETEREVLRLAGNCTRCVYFQWWRIKHTDFKE